MYKMNDTDELKISEMEEAEEVKNEDLIMIIQNGVNKKAKVLDFENSKLINVVDNLESTSATDALSAKQGNVLKEKIITKSTIGKEYITNEIMDEKKVYAKRIDFGILGNGEAKTTPHGLDFNSIEVYRVEGFAVNQTNGTIYPLCHFRWDSNASIEFWIDTTNVVINSRTDRTNVKAYVTIYYTKNDET